MKKIIILLAAIILGLSFTQYVKGSEKENVSDEVYYKNLEKNFVEVLRTSLTKEGYSSAGITINSITRPCEDREYTVSIHHYLISELDENEKSELLGRLDKITYPYENCKISYKFVE